MLSERRQLPRAIPNLPLLVYCGEYETGSLVDLCEGGLAVDGFTPGGADDVISVMFDLPETRAHIQAKGQIAWVSNSGQRVGMRFVEMADTCRQELRDWVSARAAIPGIGLGAGRDEASHPTYAALAAEPATILLQDPESEDQERHRRRAQHLVWLAIGVLCFCTAAVVLHHYLNATGNHWQIRDIRAAEKAPEIPPANPIAVSKPTPVGNPGVPGALSPDAPGYVVQVGAMKQEENADKLSEALHQKNFPAFVFKRGASPFYRVAVGVYSDADSAAKAQDQLHAQGFQTMLKRWSTEQ
jgi:hypothetical protein